MKNLILSALAIVLLASCASQDKSEPLVPFQPVPGSWTASPPKIMPQVGQTYFTRYTFHHERGRFKATNYARGAVWPINTEVKLVNIKKSRKKRKDPADIMMNPIPGERYGSFLLQRVDTDQRVRVINVEPYTKVSLSEQVSRMLSDRHTPLDHLTPEFQTAVRAGQLRLGMSKETAVMARGYPPGHRTPSLDLDTWRYWPSRFVMRTVVFKNGVLAEGRGLH